MDYAFAYVETNALLSEKDYPYRALDGACQFDESKGIVKVKTFRDVAENSPLQLKAALSKGPISVGIQADSKVF